MPMRFHEQRPGAIQKPPECTNLQLPTHTNVEIFVQEVSGGDYVVRTELVKKQSLWGDKGDTPVDFIGIVTVDARSLPKVRDKCISGSPSSSTLPSPTRLRKSPMHLRRIVRCRHPDLRKQYRLYSPVHD
jgi:hypothetical protein